MSKETVRSWVVIASAATVILNVGTARGETTFRGQEVYDMASRAIDVTDTQLRLHQAQERFGTFYTHLVVSSRWAPGRFLMTDGTYTRGNLARNQVMLGGGWGSTAAGFFLGMHADQLGGAGAPGDKQDENPNAKAKFKPGGVAQMLYYLGFSFADVQASAGILLNQMGRKQLSLDGYGNFASSDANFARPGAPANIQQAAGYDAPPNSLLLTLYDGHTGAYLALAHGDIMKTVVSESWDGSRYYRTDRSGSGVQDLRFNLQPLRHYLPDVAGLPFFSIARYYQQLADLKRSAGEQSTKPTTDFALGADDVLGAGFRWRAVLNPDYGLRIAELGYVEEFKAGRAGLLIGARGMTVKRIDAYEGAAEAFIKASLLRKQAEVPGRPVPTLVGLTFSYSYNAPESTTFIPLPQAHVLGLQFTLGPSEVARPLIPLVRAVEDKRKSEDFE